MLSRICTPTQDRKAKENASAMGAGILTIVLCGVLAGCGGGLIGNPVVLASSSASASTTSIPTKPAPAPAPTPTPVTPAPAPTPTPTPSAADDIASMTNFGDSITCGFYAYPVDGSGYIHSSAGYAGLLDAQIGAPAQNLCRPGDTAADMTRQWVYPNATPTLGASQAYTVMIGVNDANGCGTGYGCVAAFTQTLAASLAWLAMPASDKVLGANMTASAGAWTNDQTGGAASGFSMGMATTTNGATLSFTAQQAVAGRNLYLAYRVFAPWRVTTGTATLAIDGVTVGTMSTMPSTGLWIDTVNGTTDTVFLLSVPLGAVGPHTVTVTVTSPNGGFFSLLWAGASQGDYATMAGAPRVVVGQIAGTTSVPLNETIAAYNVAIAPLVAGLAADGLNVTLAQTAATLDTTTDMSDELHPNNAGHAKLAAVFASALQTVGP